MAGADAAMLWSVSDDTLASPLGTVADVAVRSDGLVYLLDSQNMVVRRIAAGGRELPSLGRHGEGPGEFAFPLALTTTPDGDCIVIQDFFKPTVCLEASGSVCSGPDLSGITNRFVSTIVRGARSDGSGRLLLTAITTTKRVQRTSSPEEVRLGTSLFVLEPDEESPAALFSNRPELCGDTTIRLDEHADVYLDRRWDIDRAGRILFADPSGAYRVIVGHPADGESTAIELKETDSDEEGLSHLAEKHRRSPESLPRIAALYWVGNDRFIVKPMACVREQMHSRAGTFELFDLEGNSYGRDSLRCDYRAGFDQFFVRNGVLVIIKNGKSAIQAAASQKAALIGERIDVVRSDDPDWDVIRVDAYSLFDYYAPR